MKRHHTARACSLQEILQLIIYNILIRVFSLILYNILRPPPISIYRIYRIRAWHAEARLLSQGRTITRDRALGTKAVLLSAYVPSLLLVRRIVFPAYRTIYLVIASSDKSSYRPLPLYDQYINTILSALILGLSMPSPYPIYLIAYSIYCSIIYRVNLACSIFCTRILICYIQCLYIY